MACPLVARQHYHLAHGIGRSGDMAAEQPKVGVVGVMLGLAAEHPKVGVVGVMLGLAAEQPKVAVVGVMLGLASIVYMNSRFPSMRPYMWRIRTLLTLISDRAQLCLWQWKGGSGTDGVCAVCKEQGSITFAFLRVVCVL